MDDKLAELLNIWSARPRLESGSAIVEQDHPPQARGAASRWSGKYVELTESYKSLNEALVHGGIANDVQGRPRLIDSPKIEEGAERLLGTCDGILVPGGFGVRGTEGKIAAMRYARERKCPSSASASACRWRSIEFARNVLGLAGANSLEFDDAPPTR